MGKPLPIFNASTLSGPQRLSALSPSHPPAPGTPGRAAFPDYSALVKDGRTVDDFKPYLIALNLTKRCNLKCNHCYLDATTKAGGGSDELSTDECYRLIDQI